MSYSLNTCRSTSIVQCKKLEKMQSPVTKINYRPFNHQLNVPGKDRDARTDVTDGRQEVGIKQLICGTCFFKKKSKNLIENKLK